jgi:hypothetical protein
LLLFEDGNINDQLLDTVTAATTRAADAGVPTGRTRQYQDLCAPADMSSCGILLFFTRLTPEDVEHRQRATAEAERVVLEEARQVAKHKSEMKVKLREE